MTDYRNEYERYYKNINRTVNGNEQKKHLLFKSREKNSVMMPYRSRNGDISYSTRDHFVKVFIRQLEGSLILLAIFAGLKAAPSESARLVRSQIKYTINKTFEYDTTIDNVSKMNIAGFELQNLHLENIKSTNIRNGLYGFMDYLKNINNTNNMNIEDEY